MIHLCCCCCYCCLTVSHHLLRCLANQFVWSVIEYPLCSFMHKYFAIKLMEYMHVQSKLWNVWGWDEVNDGCTDMKPRVTFIASHSQGFPGCQISAENFYLKFGPTWLDIFVKKMFDAVKWFCANLEDSSGSLGCKVCP